MSNDMSIQVAMDTYFPGNEWRNALLHFLNGMWADDYAVTCRPKIVFGDVTLRRSPDGKSYVCTGRNTGRPSRITILRGKMDHLYETVTTDDAVQIEHALIRFVRNDNFRTLTLKMSTGELKFLKGAKRSDLSVVGLGLSRISIIGPRGLTEQEADALDRMGHARILRHLQQ